jgi:hypothetical protein
MNTFTSLSKLLILIKVCFVFVVWGLSVGVAYAQTTTTWKGNSNSNWGNSNSWDNGVPNSTKHAIIPANGSAPVASDNVSAMQCASLTINTGASLTIDTDKGMIIHGDVNIHGSLTIKGSVVEVKGNWNNNGIYNDEVAPRGAGRVVEPPKLTLSGIDKVIKGTAITNFGWVVIKGEISLEQNMHIKPLSASDINGLNLEGTGILDPNLKKVTFESPSNTVDFNVGTGTTLKVKASTYSGNYAKVPTSLSATSTIDYAALSGTQAILGGTYGHLRISGGGVKSLTTNTSVASNLIVNGGILDLLSFTLDRAADGGSFNLANGTTLRISSANYFPSKYTSITLDANSTVEYYGTEQVVANQSYGHLTIINAGIKSLAANTTIKGNVNINSGTLDSKTFTLNRASLGGTFNVANGARFWIGGTNTFPSNYETRNLGSTSTVEYYGSAQTVTNETYGNLILRGSNTKTMPETPLVVAGNFESSGNASYTARNSITVNGNVDIGTGSTFSGSSYTITVGGNWTDNGTYNAGTSTVILSGNAKQINRTSNAATFHHLKVTGGTITTAASITMSGDLTTSGAGVLTQSAGTFTMSSSGAKSIEGNNITFHNFECSGTGSTNTTSSLTVNGNLAVNSGSTFTATSGTVEMKGATISSPGSLTFHGLRVSGTASTSSSFNINSDLSGTGKLTASAGTVTFGGTSTFAGTHDLYDITVSSGKSLTMEASANMGVAGSLLTTGILNVTANIPNTITYNGTSAQTIVNRTYHNIVFDKSGTKTAGGALTINGNLTINTGSNLNASTFSHIILGNFINRGTFDTGTNSIVSFEGGAESEIAGVTTFKELRVNKATGVGVTLNNDATATTLNMSSGTLRTGANKITVLSGRTGNGWVSGTIRRNHAFAINTPYAFNSPYTQISFTTANGVNDVSVTTNTGVINNFPAGAAINRIFNVAVNAGTYTGAKLQLQYEEAELNGNTESSLQLYKLMSGSWTSVGKDANNTSQNWVSRDNIADLGNGSYTLSATTSIYQWVGTTSNAWEVASNWRDITSGSPAVAGNYPGDTDVVELGGVNATHHPTITKNESIKSIRFLGAFPASLTLNSGVSLFVLGNLAATGSGTTITHTLNVNAGNLTVGGDLILNDGSNGNNINLTIGSGTVNVIGTLKQPGISRITMGSGNLKLSGDFIYTPTISLAFEKGTGTVTYEGSGTQTIGAAFYNNVIIDKPSGVATLNAGATTGYVNGNVTVSRGSLSVPSGTYVIVGNIIQNGGVINIGNSNVTLGGTWTKTAGTFEAGTSTVTLQGSSIKATSPLSFHDLKINRGAGNTLAIDDATINNGITINNALTIQSGILDLGTKTIDRNAVGGTFTMNSGSKLIVSGSNFPANYNSNILDPNSTVEYNSAFQQNVKPISYGHLTLKNGASANPKKLTGATRTNGKLTIEGNAKLDGDGHTLTLSGDFEVKNGGIFTAGATHNRGTLVLTKPAIAAQKQLTGTFEVNNLLLEAEADYKLVSGNLTIKGNFTNQGSIDAVTNNAIFEGDFLNTGILKSSGLAKFSGTRLQTIQLQAPITGSVPHPTIPGLMLPPAVEFNGSVAPVLSSTAEPNFGKITINNTDPVGIRATVAWTVNLDFNVAANATFDGGPYTHNFHTAILNSGTIKSSGTIKFLPSGLAGLASYPIKFGNSATAFQSTGTLEIGGTHLVALAGVVPATLNDVIIKNTNAAGVSTQTLSADLPLDGTNWNIAGSIEISSGAKFNAGLGTTYSISGDIINNGTFNGAGGNFTFTGTNSKIKGVGVTTLNKLTIGANANFTLEKDLNLNGDLVHNGISFNTSDSEINFEGSANSLISSSGSSLNIEHLKVHKSDPVATVTLRANLKSVYDVVVNSGVFDLADKSLTMSENASSTTLQVDNGAKVRIKTATVPAFETFTLAENSIVEYYGTNQAIKSIQYGNLALANSGVATFETGEAFIAGELTLVGGTDQTVVVPDKIIYNGSGTQNIAAISYKDLTLDNAGIKSFVAGVTSVSGVLATTGTATATAASSGVTVDYNGSGAQDILAINYRDLKLSTGGVKKFGTGTTGIAGALTIIGATADAISNASTINYNSAAPQDMPGLAYHSLLVSGSGEKTLLDNATIAQRLELSGGTVAKTGNNRFVLEPTATIVESKDNYVTGFVETQRADVTSFENFGGIGIEVSPTQPLGTVTVLRETGRAVGVTGNSLKRNYSFATTGTNKDLDATVTFQYFEHELNGLSEDKLMLYTSADGVGWKQHDSSVPAGNGRVGANKVNSLGYMTLGGSNSPLPVDLGYFRAEKRSGEAVLTWTTTSEEENRGFGVEVSLDGENYRQIGFVSKGTGTSRVAVLYTFTDKENNKEGVRYYRLRQEDFGSRVSYYGPRAVDFKEGAAVSAAAYPNPFKEFINITLPEADGTIAIVRLSDISGRVVLKQSLSVVNGGFTVDMPNGKIPAGMYLLTVEAGDKLHKLKIMKK